MSSIFVVQLLLCLTPCDPMDCSTQSFPVLHYLPEVAQIHVHWVGDASNHLILCQPHLLWPSIFPSIRVFPNESALHIRWPKYWSFNFSISPSSEYSGMISFRIDWAIHSFWQRYPTWTFEYVTSWAVRLVYQHGSLCSCFIHRHRLNRVDLFRGDSFIFLPSWRLLCWTVGVWEVYSLILETKPLF